MSQTPSRSGSHASRQSLSAFPTLTSLSSSNVLEDRTVSSSDDLLHALTECRDSLLNYQAASANHSKAPLLAVPDAWTLSGLNVDIGQLLVRMVNAVNDLSARSRDMERRNWEHAVTLTACVQYLQSEESMVEQLDTPSFVSAMKKSVNTAISETINDLETVRVTPVVSAIKHRDARLERSTHVAVQVLMGVHNGFNSKTKLEWPQWDGSKKEKVIMADGKERDVWRVDWDNIRTSLDFLTAVYDYLQDEEPTEEWDIGAINSATVTYLDGIAKRLRKGTEAMAKLRDIETRKARMTNYHLKMVEVFDNSPLNLCRERALYRFALHQSSAVQIELMDSEDPYLISKGERQSDGTVKFKREFDLLRDIWYRDPQFPADVWAVSPPRWWSRQIEYAFWILLESVFSHFQKTRKGLCNIPVERHISRDLPTTSKSQAVLEPLGKRRRIMQGQICLSMVNPEVLTNKDNAAWVLGLAKDPQSTAQDDLLPTLDEVMELPQYQAHKAFAQRQLRFPVSMTEEQMEELWSLRDSGNNGPYLAALDPYRAKVEVTP